MIRLTHRLCHMEQDGILQVSSGLLRAVRDLETQNESLADDLQATEHQMHEVRLACEDLEYGITEAVIPDCLRDRLTQLQRLQEERERALLAADET